jgi:hypothetical protein
MILIFVVKNSVKTILPPGDYNLASGCFRFRSALPPVLCGVLLTATIDNNGGQKKKVRFI